MLTRDRKRAILQKILKDFLDTGPQDPISLALQRAGISEIHDFTGGMNIQTDVERLVYTGRSDPAIQDSPRIDIPLNMGEKGKIRSLLGFLLDKYQGSGVPDDEWDLLSPEEYDSYRTSGRFLLTPAQVTTLKPQSTVHPSEADKAVSNFEKSVRRDMTVFKPLEKDTEWDNWNRDLQVQARAQGVGDVLDVNKTPPIKNTPAYPLWDLKQIYVFAVFNKTLQTSVGKQMFREQAKLDDNDAHGLYISLVRHYEQSTHARLTSTTLLKYIVSATLGANTWNGSTHDFILHWCDKVRQYEDMTDMSAHMHDGVKHVLLENAVSPIAELRQVKTTGDIQAQSVNSPGKYLSYENYIALLVSAAQQYDAQNLNSNSSTRRSRRSVYSTSVEYTDTDEYHSVDTDVPTLLAFRVRMSGQAWRQLDEADRVKWDTVSDKGKEIILGDMSSTPGSQRPRQGGRGRPPPSNTHRSVNFTDVHDDIHADSNMGSEFFNCVEEQDDVPVNGDVEQPLLAMATKSARSASAASMANMLSPSKGSAPTKFSAKKTSSAPTDDIEELLAYKGVVYRKVNMHRVYSVSKSTRSENLSLVDRGANGGIGGQDVRVISRTNRDVYIEGLDNHRLANIPLVTAAGLMTAQQGPVIGIFHQYALVGRGASIHSSVQLETHGQRVDNRAAMVGGS